MKKQRLCFFVLLCVMGVCLTACGGDDDGVQTPPVQTPMVKTSEYFTEIVSHKYTKASFVDTSLGTMAAFYTDAYNDANGNTGVIEVIGRVAGPFTEHPESKGNIQLSEIAVQRIFSSYDVYWRVKTKISGEYKFKGGYVNYTKRDDGTYHVVLRGGPLIDDKNNIIESLEITYDGIVDIGSMLEY